MQRTYNVTITGKSPLLMHWDNIEWADEMKAWSSAPENKKLSMAGDDRSPGWRWFGYLYNDGQHIALPADNLMRSLMEGGASVPVPGGKGGKTFKSQSQSGMMVGEPYWPMFVDGRLVKVSELATLRGEMDIARHREVVKSLGFDLMIKRAAIERKKHVRVRPKFDRWAAKGTIVVWDDQITDKILQDILAYAGSYKGLGDWRPSSKTPGAYGMFDAEVKLAR